MLKLYLYLVTDRYIHYLSNFVSQNIFSNIGTNYRTSRKYLGVVLEIGNYKYYVPLSSPKNSDYLIDKSGQQVIRKSIIPIIRIIEFNSQGQAHLLGTLKFNSMIPVPDSEIIIYDLRQETDIKYKTLIEKEIRFINRNTKIILDHASVIYKQKISGLDIN